MLIRGRAIDAKSIASTKLDNIMNEFQEGEFFAHDFAYRKDLKKLASVDRLKINSRNYELIIPTTVAGLVCYILIPHASENIKVIFRGTQCRFSIKRNLEHRGAGNLSFEKCKINILNKINGAVATYIKKNKTDKVGVTIYGHSLGGADAQQCVAALMDVLVQHSPKAGERLINSDKSYFSYITFIKMMAYNATGVTRDLAAKAKQDATILSLRGIQITCFWQHAAGDVVQQTGEASILSDVDQSIAKVHLLKITYQDIKEKVWKNFFAINQAYNAFMNVLPAHTNFCHKAQSKIAKHEYFVNSSVESIAVIHKKLSLKNAFLQSFPMRWLQWGAYHIVNIGLKFTSSDDVNLIEDPIADPFVLLSPVLNSISPLLDEKIKSSSLPLKPRWKKPILDEKEFYSQNNQTAFSKTLQAYANSFVLGVPCITVNRNEIKIEPVNPDPQPVQIPDIKLIQPAVLANTHNSSKTDWRMYLVGALVGMAIAGAIFCAVASMGLALIGYAALGAVIGAAITKGVKYSFSGAFSHQKQTIDLLPSTGLSVNARMTTALGIKELNQKPLIYAPAPVTNTVPEIKQVLESPVTASMQKLILA